MISQEFLPVILLISSFGGRLLSVDWAWGPDAGNLLLSVKASVCVSIVSSQASAHSSTGSSSSDPLTMEWGWITGTNSGTFGLRLSAGPAVYGSGGTIGWAGNGRCRGRGRGVKAGMCSSWGPKGCMDKGWWAEITNGLPTVSGIGHLVGSWTVLT